jgi:hypothetical protein
MTQTTRVRGDGLSVHDEYRGFHVLDAQNPPKWISTDPTRQDLFYSDAGGFGKAAVDSILGNTTSAFIDLHAVNEHLSNGNRATTKEEDTGRLNKNTKYPQSRAYALIYTNASLDRGVIGRSGEPGEYDLSLRNAGTHIHIDKAKIEGLVKWRETQPGTRLAQVIAHETGHKLSREHPVRCADTPVAYDHATAPSLKINEFMQESRGLSDLYVRYKLYGLDGQPQKSESLGPNNINHKTARETPTPSGETLPDWVYAIKTEREDTKRPLCALYQVEIQTQENKLMDWTPNLNLTSPESWNWHDRDKNGFCLRNQCDTRRTAWPNCQP